MSEMLSSFIALVNFIFSTALFADTGSRLFPFLFRHVVGFVLFDFRIMYGLFLNFFYIFSNQPNINIH